MEVVNIPLNTKVSTSTLDDGIHKIDSVLLNKKSSIVYQNALSNMKSTRGDENTWLLTDGSEIEITADGIINKTTGDTWEYNNKYILRDTNIQYDKSRGEWLSSAVYNDSIYSVYKKTNTSIVVYKDDEIVKTISDNDAIFVNGVFSSTYSFTDTVLEPLLIVSSATRNGTSYNNTAVAYYVTDLDTSIELYTNVSTASTRGPLAPVKYATHIENTAEYLVIGCDDSDQRRCQSYVYSLDNTTATQIREYFGFGCVSPDGIISGEPIPILTSASSTASYTYSTATSNFGITVCSNGQLKWNLLNSPSASDALSCGHYGGYASGTTTISAWVSFWRKKLYSIMYAITVSVGTDTLTWAIAKQNNYTSTSNLTEVPMGYRTGSSTDYYTYYKYMQTPKQMLSYIASQHISPDQIGELIPVDETSEYDNPSGIYWFSNVQADKGKYWDYGPGWTKFMIFVAGPAGILRAGSVLSEYTGQPGTRTTGTASDSYYWQCGGYAHQPVKLYTYGLSYPQYTEGDTVGTRKLVSVTIDPASSKGTIADYNMCAVDFSGTTLDNMNCTLGNVATSSTFSYSAAVYDSTFDQAADDSIEEMYYQQWGFASNNWRFINCCDDNPFPYLGSLAMIPYMPSGSSSYSTTSVVYSRWRSNNYLEPLVLTSGETPSTWTPGVISGSTETPTSYDAVYLRYNPIIKCMIGGNISNVDSFINLIPDIVPVIPTPDDEDANWSVQYYDGLPISHSFSGTLISSGSDGRQESWTYFKDANNQYLCVDGYVYNVYEWDPTTEYELLSVTKLADYRFKLNIIDGYNLITCNDVFEYKRSFYSYNMYGMFSTSAISGALSCPNTPSGAANDTWYYAAGVNPMMIDGSDTSYLLPAVTVPIYVDSTYLQTFNNKIVNGRNPIIQPIMHKSFVDDDKLEVFYTHSLDSTDVTYKSTNVYRSYGSGTYASFGNPQYDTTLANTSWWITSDIIIFPLGLATVINDYNYQTPTIKLLNDYYARMYINNGNTFLSFNESSLLNNASTVFTIYANNYYYDGTSIYFAGSGNNTYSESQFVCYALNMQFLGNSGTEAYFYSDFEKRIYIFTGSNTLQAQDSLSKFGNVIDKAYSSHEQILYLLNDNKQLLIRTPLDESILDLPYSGHLETTNKGIAIVYDDLKGYDLLSPHTGNNVFELNFETGYIGDSNSLYSFPYFDVMLYNDNTIRDDKITLGFNIVNDNTPVEETKTIRLKGLDWKGNNARIRMNPANNVGNAFKIIINATDDVCVTDIAVAVQQVSTDPNARNRPRR